jgi:hypothetical protein
MSRIGKPALMYHEVLFSAGFLRLRRPVIPLGPGLCSAVRCQFGCQCVQNVDPRRTTVCTEKSQVRSRGSIDLHVGGHTTR